MSHRVYLYNISAPSEAQDRDKMMMEWGPEKRLSRFEFDLLTRKAHVNGFAYAFKGPDVYVVDTCGLSRADKILVLDDAEDPYYNYYFDANVRRETTASTLLSLYATFR
ncbi:hypothetical protein [Brevibacillus sp. NRS-1366]|uniref:hypothetical protein n=1 Tax=Brevibacillus sp. NRS-1366 TaxID=3233899 RepID=UPI003D1D0913